MRIEELYEKFAAIFGNGGKTKSYFAPGRVNLIGEHIDYNGGHVLPCALTMGNYMVVRKRKDRMLNFYSENFKHWGVITSSLDDLTYRKEAQWTNYPKAVIWAYQKKGYGIAHGFDVYINGDIPDGSGLSSSASIQLLTGVMLKDALGLETLHPIEVALLCQYSENHFIGVNCGVMDQFSVAMGKKNQAIYLNTDDLSYEYVPLELNEAKLVIACSNKKRTLADSVYNERRSECETALRELRMAKCAKKENKLKNLCDLKVEEFEALKDAISDSIRVKRARHAVYEEWRTKRSVEALKKGDIEEFGRFMNESHVSLRDDYEVTGVELDALVEEAWKSDGVIGSRMTGAGLGGCTVSIVREDAVESFIHKVGGAFLTRIGYEASFYIAEIGNGAGAL